MYLENTGKYWPFKLQIKVDREASIILNNFMVAILSKSQLVSVRLTVCFTLFLSPSRVPFNPRYSKQWSENVHKQQPPGSFKTTEWHRAEGQTGSREHDSDVLQRLLQGEHSTRGAGLTRLSGFCGVLTECQVEWDWNANLTHCEILVLILARWHEVALYESAAERFQLRFSAAVLAAIFKKAWKSWARETQGLPKLVTGVQTFIPLGKINNLEVLQA